MSEDGKLLQGIAKFAGGKIAGYVANQILEQYVAREPDKQMAAMSESLHRLLENIKAMLEEDELKRLRSEVNRIDRDIQAVVTYMTGDYLINWAYGEHAEKRVIDSLEANIKKLQDHMASLSHPTLKNIGFDLYISCLGILVSTLQELYLVYERQSGYAGSDHEYIKTEQNLIVDRIKLQTGGIGQDKVKIMIDNIIKMEGANNHIIEEIQRKTFEKVDELPTSKYKRIIGTTKGSMVLVHCGVKRVPGRFDGNISFNQIIWNKRFATEGSRSYQKGLRSDIHRFENIPGSQDFYIKPYIRVTDEFWLEDLDDEFRSRTPDNALEMDVKLASKGFKRHKDFVVEGVYWYKRATNDPYAWPMGFEWENDEEGVKNSGYSRLAVGAEHNKMLNESWYFLHTFQGFILPQIKAISLQRESEWKKRIENAVLGSMAVIYNNPIRIPEDQLSILSEARTKAGI